MLARLARVFVVLTLLAGWQAALQHPIAHVDELGEFVHRHAGHSHDDGSEAGLLCDLLDSLTACAPDATSTAVVAAAVEQRLRPQPAIAPRVAQAPPFLSQGPPRSA